MYNKTEGDLQGNDRYVGYSMDLLTEIAKVLNIKFEFRLVPSNKHDDLVNDLVARVRAHIPPGCHFICILLCLGDEVLMRISCSRGQTSPFVT
jgi:hypothetical protein